MKILLANCVYKHGSTGKILYDTKNYLESLGDKVVVAYGRQQKPALSEKNIYKFCTEIESYFCKFLNIVGALEYKGGFLATKRLIHVIKKEQPDVVHLHCMNGYCVDLYRLLRFLSNNKTKTIITHHAEFYYTGSCGHAFECDKWYTTECKECPNKREATGSRTISQTHRAWKLMHDAINGFDVEKLTFTAVSPWVKERSLLSPIVNKYKCEVVLNGVETTIFKRNNDRRILEDQVAHLKNKVLLFVTAEFRPDDKKHNKGGWFLVELARRMPDFSFIVVASYNHITNKLPENVYVWGRAKDQHELATLYSTADVTLVLSKRETFSMVCAESLCCGTPVVGFKAGGPESIAIGEYCAFVEYGDVSTLTSAVSEIANASFDKDEICAKSTIKYSIRQMVEGYEKMYNN